MNKLQLADFLLEHESDIRARPIVTGFDAFVDEMITAVEERTNVDAFRRVEDISRFAELIDASAGHSSLREIVVTRTDAGGCAVNMGDGLATLGVPVTTFATLGEPMDPAFGDYASKATVHSWGRLPGRTLAFEFADGKLMFSSVSHLAEFTPDDLAARIADGSFAQACNTARVIGITNWTLYPHMTACWKFLQENVFSKLSHRPTFFFDLVDPSTRSEADIRAMLETLQDFEACGTTVLGLNQNEANILARITGGQALREQERGGAEEQAAALRQEIGVSEVVTHSVKYAAVATSTGTASVDGPFCAKPVKSTGAGDRFNAGYALGLLLELEPADRALLAVATSGLYVRLGRSPTLAELGAFLREWETETTGA